MRFCLVSTRRGSHFMTELLRALAMSLAERASSVELTFDSFPAPGEADVYVAIPHEFHAWGDPNGFPDAEQRARTIALCTENPGTEWFEATYRLLDGFAAAVSINRSSAAELRRRGVRCEHVQLGYSPAWDSWHGDSGAQRPIDVLYLGAADPRRDPLLAGFGEELSERVCQLLIPPLEQRTRPRPDFLVEEDKYARLRSAQVLLNLHRTTSAALEWMRFLEAICNGAVVVSEPCLDSEPLVPDEHFVAAPVDGIPRAMNRLLDDPDRLRLMRERAYDFVRHELPMRAAADRLLELACELPRVPSGTFALAPASPRQAPVRPLIAPVEPRSGGSPGWPADAPPESAGGRDALTAAGGSARAVPSFPGALLRRLRHVILAGRQSGRGDGLRVLARTPAHAHGSPRISVLCVATPDRWREPMQALASACHSKFAELELLVSGRPANGRLFSELQSFLADRHQLPALLLEESDDVVLGRSLNALLARARAEYVFVLNPTGGIYPSTLPRLLEALDATPQALFCYPMVGVFEGHRAVELRGSLPWEPERLRGGNWIDAMALIRRAPLRELGGFSTDARLAGWEEFELWCRCAQAAAAAVQVPQVLAWHRRTADPTGPGEGDRSAKWALMRARFPELLAAPVAW
jgi:hypothetical protein